jgi:hypothetical protein
MGGCFGFSCVSAAEKKLLTPMRSKEVAPGLAGALPISSEKKPLKSKRTPLVEAICPEKENLGK